jgi:hypothetical protein
VSVRNTTHGWGALTSAAANGHAEVSQALLAAGADPNAPDAQSYTPLDYVVDYQGPDCALAAMLRAAGGAHSAAVLEKLSEASRGGGAGGGSASHPRSASFFRTSISSWLMKDPARTGC